MVVYHLLRSVHSVGKLFAKFRTGEFGPGIAFTICTNQFHYFTGKRPRRPETGIKDGFEKMEHKFPFGIFHSEKQDYLLDVPLLLGIFCWEEPKSRVSFTFQPEFPENFCKW